MEFKILPRGIDNITTMTLFSLLPDKPFNFLKALFKGAGFINQRRPKTYNDFICSWKVQVNNHLAPFVDKGEVKDILRTRGLERYIIPTIFIGDSVESIPWEKLPETFVIKCTHDSGSAMVVEDKAQIDITQVANFYRKRLKHRYSRRGRERVYDHIKPRIIIEEVIGERESLVDYKFWCFNGNVELIQVDYDRHTNHKRSFYSREWEIIELEIGYPRDVNRINTMPSGFEEMLEIAEALSAEFVHVRVDLYNINGRVYFGEMTFFHGAGFEYFKPADWGVRLGNLMR